MINKTTPPKLIICTKIFIALLTATCHQNVMAVSLDEAVQQQLAVDEDILIGGCHQLQTINGGSPQGPLLNICGRALPLQTGEGGSGGGSATPSTVPNIDNNVIDSPRLGKWNMFITVEQNTLDRLASETESSYNGDMTRALMGATLRPNPNHSLSILTDLSNYSGDYEDGGDFDTDKVALAFIYGFSLNQKSALTLSVGYDDISTERQRSASFFDLFGAPENQFTGSPIADFSYNQFRVSAQYAYQLNFKRLNIKPIIGIDWQETDYGTYDEQGNSGLELTFHDDKRESLLSAIGVQFSYSFGTDTGAFLPYFGITQKQEHENESRDVNVSFVYDANSIQFSYQTDDIDDQFFEANAGAIWVLKRGTQVFLDINSILEHNDYDSTSLNIGLRKEL